MPYSSNHNKPVPLTEGLGDCPHGHHLEARIVQKLAFHVKWQCNHCGDIWDAPYADHEIVRRKTSTPPA